MKKNPSSTAAHPALPLLAPRELGAPIAWCQGVPVSAGQFVAEALALAESLPAQGRPVNLCQDRYLFALGLAAALLRGQTSLLPPNGLPETLQQVPAEGAPPYLMGDAAVGDAVLAAAGLPVLRVVRPAGCTPVRAVPTVDAGLQAVCLLTSGSTGAPQPHAKRFGELALNIGAEAERLAAMLGLASLAGLTLVATVPAQHSYGLESSVLLALLGGASFEAGRPYFPANIADALASVPRPRALVTTPFHLKTLLLAGVALPPADLVLSATAPLSPQLASQAEAGLGAALIEIYGCTEAGQVASRRTTEGDVWTTLGALRLARDVDAEGSEHWRVSGGHVAVPTPLADVLELHDDRRFRLLGRANDLIHVAGKRSSLAHLNFHLNRIEGVADGAFWLPDELAEAVVRPVAFVVAPGVPAARVIAALRRHLEPTFVPRRVVHVAALPREATGKLTAAALRAFALTTLAAAAQPDEAAAAPWTVPASHPAFVGHFPGHPVLPGAALLAQVLALLAARPALRARLGLAPDATPDIAHAKFLAPVLPGAVLRLAWHDGAAGVAFELWQGEAPVVRGLLTTPAAPQ